MFPVSASSESSIQRPHLITLHVTLHCFSGL